MGLPLPIAVVVQSHPSLLHRSTQLAPSFHFQSTTWLSYPIFQASSGRGRIVRLPSAPVSRPFGSPEADPRTFAIRIALKPFVHFQLKLTASLLPVAPPVEPRLGGQTAISTKYTAKPVELGARPPPLQNLSRKDEPAISMMAALILFDGSAHFLFC